jgi:hypothetical protein
LVLKTKVCNYVHCSIKQWNQSNKNAKYKKWNFIINDRNVITLYLACT